MVSKGVSDSRAPFSMWTLPQGPPPSRWIPPPRSQLWMPPVHGQGGEGLSGCLQLPKQRREGSALRQGRGSHYGNPASLQGQKPGRMAVGRGDSPIHRGHRVVTTRAAPGDAPNSASPWAAQFGRAPPSWVPKWAFAGLIVSCPPPLPSGLAYAQERVGGGSVPILSPPPAILQRDGWGGFSNKAFRVLCTML